MKKKDYKLNVGGMVAGFALIVVGALLMSVAVCYMFWAPGHIAVGWAAEGGWLHLLFDDGLARELSVDDIAAALDAGPLWVQGTVLSAFTFIGGIGVCVYGGHLAKSSDRRGESIDAEERERIDKAEKRLRKLEKKNAKLRGRIAELERGRKEPGRKAPSGEPAGRSMTSSCQSEWRETWQE